MAKCVDVCRPDQMTYEKRQLPLVVDDTLSMVVQFTDACLGCEQQSFKQRDLERFAKRFHALSKDEIAAAMMVSSREVLNIVTQLVPCVGCRRSVEKLFNELVESGTPALEPLVITPTSILSIKHEALFDPKAIYPLFYVHGQKLNLIMDSIPKSRKSKRCVIHSLDTHKVKILGMWIDVWEVLSDKCREEVLFVECCDLIETLENYLRKHRFCGECKSKVHRAYNILIGEVDVATEKGYCASLYDGLRCCQTDKHIHVKQDTKYVAKLIGRAEPELNGIRRERHAKTLDIAQEEVLTCLGIFLWDRLHRISQKLREREQTWQLLFYLGVDALKKNFEITLEKKQGISNLELMCQELAEEEQAKEQKKELKRQKKKKKKNKKLDKNHNQIKCGDYEPDEKATCKCDENTNIASAICAACDLHIIKTTDFQSVAPESTCQCNTKMTQGGGKRGKMFSPNNIRCHQELGNEEHIEVATCNRSDCGYSSGAEGCDSCETNASQDGSVNGDSPLCHRHPTEYLCTHCHSHYSSSSRNCDGGLPVSVHLNLLDNNCRYGPQRSLQDMLEEPPSGDDGEVGISEEEIKRFKENRTQMDSRRQELRATLRERFANMKQWNTTAK